MLKNKNQLEQRPLLEQRSAQNDGAIVFSANSAFKPVNKTYEATEQRKKRHNYDPRG